MTRGQIRGRVTRFMSDRPTILGKTFRLGPEGALIKEAAGAMSRGRARVEAFDDCDSLVTLLQSFGPNEALSASIPTPAAVEAWQADAAQFQSEAEGPVVAEAMRADLPGTVSRSRLFFSLSSAGVLICDQDPAPGARHPEGKALHRLVTDVVPELCSAGAVYWLSASSEVWNGTQQLSGIRGQRLYFLIADTADAPRVLNIINVRAALLGHIWTKISTSGSIRMAMLFDPAMGESARLDFAPAGAIVHSPLESRRAQPVTHCRGGFANTRSTDDLTKDELDRFAALVESLRHRAQAEAQIKRDEWRAGRERTAMADAIVKGEDVEEVRATVRREIDAALGGTLLGSFELVHVDDWGNEVIVTVDQVLADRRRWHGRSFLDPIDPNHRGRSPDAILYADQPQPILFSLDDGGISYRLLAQPATLAVTPGGKAALADQVSEHLRTDSSIYVVGGSLVRASNGALNQISRPMLAYLTGCTIALYRVDPKGKRVAMDPDDALMAMVHALLTERARSVAFRASIPLICTDGRVVERPGHDSGTQGYLDLVPGSVEAIPMKPARQQLIDALRRTWKPWSAYPWATPNDRAAMLATVLTVPLRPTIDCAPGLLVDSPLQASGKSLATGAISALVRGSRGGAKVWLGDNDVELEKYLLAVLRAGEPSVNFDNVMGVFRSSTLATTMAEGRLQARLLGFSEAKAPEARVMWLASGVNIALDRDMSTRWLRARIDTGSASPQSIAYPFDPIQVALGDRLGIVRAAIILHRGFHDAGRPARDGIATRFADWGLCVRNLVLWLCDSAIAEEAGNGNLGDPAASILERNCAADPESEALATLLSGLEETFGAEPFTSGEVHRAFRSGESSLAQGSNDIFEGITALMPRARHGASSQAIGAVLRNRRDRPAANLKLIEVPQYGRAASRGSAWRVVAA